MSTLEDLLRGSETYKTFAISSQPPRFGDETSTSVTLSYHGAGKSNRPEVGIINEKLGTVMCVHPKDKIRLVGFVTDFPVGTLIWHRKTIEDLDIQS